MCKVVINKARNNLTEEVLESCHYKYEKDKPDDEILENHSHYTVSNCSNEEIVSCCICKEQAKKEGALYLEDRSGYMCEKCFNRFSLVCVICNKRILIDKAKSIKGCNHPVCEDCYKENIVKCDICDSYLHEEDSIRLTSYDLYICPSCADVHLEVCSGCERLFFEDDLVYIDFPGLGIEGYCCTQCREGTCDRCGESFDMISGHQYGETLICNDCYAEVNEYNNRSRYLHEHSYKPTPMFKNGKDDNDNFYIGFELEVEINHEGELDEAISLLKSYKDVNELIYFKRDGSLNCGFEVVSHPFTYKWYKENKKTLDIILSTLVEEGYLSYNTDTCGMHIHMSKDVISGLSLYKMIELIYRNKDFTYVLSQRRRKEELDDYASLERELDKSARICKCKMDDYHGRYQAINITNGTIELRFFKGTLKKESFYKNIEFAFALKEYVDNTSIKDIDYKSFYRFIKNKGKKYINLINFIERKEKLMRYIDNKEKEQVQ